MIVTTRNFNGRTRRFGKPKQICEATLPPLVTENENGDVVIMIDEAGVSSVEITMDHETMRGIVGQYHRRQNLLNQTTNFPI